MAKAERLAPPISSRSSLNDLLNGVTRPDSDVKHEVASAHSQAQDAAASLRDAVARMHETEDQAWRRYGAEVGNARAQMEAELAAAETQLRIEQADSHDQLSAALRRAADTWRARAGEVKLQIRLGQMEGRDAGLRAIDELDRAGNAVVAMTEELRQDTAASISTLRCRTRTVADDFRDALRGVALAFRGDPHEAAEEKSPDHRP